MNLESLGLIGIFLAGAIPWMEAVAVVPAGILLGLSPVATVTAAVLGNAVTIVVFAYLGATIRTKIVQRRRANGKGEQSARFERAQKGFDKYGIYGMAALGPVLIGTQFAAAACVAAGVKPLRASLLITAGMVLWATGIALAMVTFDVSLDVF